MASPDRVRGRGSLIAGGIAVSTGLGTIAEVALQQPQDIYHFLIGLGGGVLVLLGVATIAKGRSRLSRNSFPPHSH